MKALLLSAVLLHLIPDATACVNVDGTDLHGNSRISSGPFPAKILKSSLQQSPVARLARLTEARSGKTDDDFSRRELEGVECLFDGRYERAVELFKQNEAEQPGRYSTAANLGTACELTGDLESALKWISEGIIRNPESHQGTEWLHVMILQTRIKLKQDPSYLDKNRVLDISEQVSGKTIIDLDGQRFSTKQVANALLYQLSERMFFVKPPDPVVADLLFAYARLEAGTVDVESGLQLLEMARDYGFRDQALLEGETSRYRSAILMQKARTAATMVLGGLALLSFLVFAYRKKWFFLSRSEYRRHLQERAMASNEAT